MIISHIKIWVENNWNDLFCSFTEKLKIRVLRERHEARVRITFSVLSREHGL